MTKQTKMGPPPWSEAPYWAEERAMDESGDWYFYGGPPSSGATMWLRDGYKAGVVPDYKFDAQGRSWTDTLESRPTDTADDWTGHISPCAMHSYEDEAPHDPVSRPSHYTAGGIECIDAIRAALTTEEFRGFVKGNALKYTWRERMKGGDEDLRKANWYLNKLNEEQE